MQRVCLGGLVKDPVSLRSCINGIADVFFKGTTCGSVGCVCRFAQQVCPDEFSKEKCDKDLKPECDRSEVSFITANNDG